MTARRQPAEAARDAANAPARPASPDAAAAGAVTEATRAIDAAVDSGTAPPTLAELASRTHVSATHLRRVFTEALGVTPRAYADARRASRLRDALADGSPVADAIHESGYGSPSRVYERSNALLGMTPARARKGAPGERITYALADSTLGRVLVATTERGVCLVVFGDDDADLVAEAVRRFPRALLDPASGDYADWVAAVVAAIDAKGCNAASAAASAVPLDARGTVFQQQVWSALREIPAGETFTYAQLAAAIGRPTAMRAVAQACGANPTAVVVPCHRVIGADGSLTGYRWGVERKKALLERERG